MKTCKERIQEAFKMQIEELRKIWKRYLTGESEEIYEYGLGFDYVPLGSFQDQQEGYFRYQLSWGGPAEEFRFFVDPDLQIRKIEYWYLDWFDGAKLELSGKDFELLKEIFEWFKGMGLVEKELKEAGE